MDELVAVALDNGRHGYKYDDMRLVKDHLRKTHTILEWGPHDCCTIHAMINALVNYGRVAIRFPGWQKNKDECLLVAIANACKIPIVEFEDL